MFTGMLGEQKDSFCKEFKWSTEKPIALVVTGGLVLEYFARFAGNGSTSSESLRTVDYFLRIAQKVTNVNFLFKFPRGLQNVDFFQNLSFYFG